MSPESIATIGSMDSGLALRAPRNDEVMWMRAADFKSQTTIATPSRSRRVYRARYGLLVPPSSSEGAGNAGRPMRPMAACAGVVIERTRVSQVTPESPGIPRAMVYGLCRTLPGDRAFLSPSLLRSLLLRSLTPASRRQDHTILPSASRAIRQRHIGVHRIPLRVRDVAQRPSVWGGTAADMKVICANTEAEYFCAKGWTGFE